MNGENVLGRERLGKVVGGRGRRVVVEGGRANPRRGIDDELVRARARSLLPVSSWKE